MVKLLLGNEAIAFGAIRSGVQVVTGYPGTPSSEILETVAKSNDGSIYVEWSVNEKAALEVAAGAAYAGARAMVTMKQVGLNVASDPLMSLNYVGIRGSMVVVVADDPGPISSQTEQDTRHFAQFAKLALFDPSTPEEAYTMIADAFAISEKYGAPVLFRPTTRVCHSCATVTMLDNIPAPKPAGFVKSSRWVIFPKLSYTNHIKIEENLVTMRDEFSAYKNNSLTMIGNKGGNKDGNKDGNKGENIGGNIGENKGENIGENKSKNKGEYIGESKGENKGGNKGIATGGVSYSYTREALGDEQCKLLKISTIPFPEKLSLEFLNGLDEALVVEELDPVIENELIRICGLYNIKTIILGKQTGHVQNAGENTADSVSKAINEFLNTRSPEPTGATLSPCSVIAAKQNTQPSLPLSVQQVSAQPPSQASPSSTPSLAPAPPPPPPLPVRPPVLCAGCPHRASFLAVKEAVRGKRAIFCGDIGCYTLGNAQPLEMVDTCLCMGAGITIAQGLHRMAPDAAHFAFIGDSTFFHSGITGIINAVYNQTDIIVAVLDNSTTAMTGNQPHPGTGVTMMGGKSQKISIKSVVEAIGVSMALVIDPFDHKAAKDAVKSALAQKGVRVLIFEAPCIVVSRGKRSGSAGSCTVDTEKCIGCRICINKTGCPVLLFEQGKASIDQPLCTGCGLCACLCPRGAIS